MDREGLLLIGRVVRAHGLRGAVEVQVFSGDPGEFCNYQDLTLIPPSAGGQKDSRPALPAGGCCRIRNCKAKGRAAILQLEGIEDRNDAERLSGAELWVAKATLPRPAPGEFYWHEVIGMTVLSREGLDLGRVKALFSTRAHDVLVVEGEQEVLIPAVAAFIERIDYEQKIIVVAPPPGLLEMNG